MRRWLALVVVVSVLTPGSAAVADHRGEGENPGFLTGSCELGGAVAPGSSGVVHEVGPDKTHSTIQSAVDAASEGDAILVHPGTYSEHVVVTTPGLRIRGTDRDGVVLDGGADVAEDGTKTKGLRHAIEVTADRVLVENMTGHSYEDTPFYWHGVTGYWGRYLTAYNNHLYGIYAIGSRCGQLDHSYGSGNADSAFYIGECFPCDAVITDVVAEENALGYSGTNAGGNLTIRDSVWAGNGLGIVPNSLLGEERPPQRGTTILRNEIVDNNGQDVPGVGLAGTFWGVGIAIAGGQGNVVSGNTVLDHAEAGIVLAPLPDLVLGEARAEVWLPSGNTIWGNSVGHDPVEWPDAFDLAQNASAGPNNCWTDNAPPDGLVMTQAPPVLQTVWHCEQTLTPPGGDPRVEIELVAGAAGFNGRVQSPWQTWPAPTNPAASEDLVDDACDVGGDCAVDPWLPALGIS